MVAERTIVGYFVEGAGSLFPDFQSAQDWRNAQIWDGGIGMTPEPEAVYAPPEQEEKPQPCGCLPLCIHGIADCSLCEYYEGHAMNCTHNPVWGNSARL